MDEKGLSTTFTAINIFYHSERVACVGWEEGGGCSIYRFIDFFPIG